MYSAAFSLFWPCLRSAHPDVQNTVEPSPLENFGSGPKCRSFGSSQLAAIRSGAEKYLKSRPTRWAAKATSSGVPFTPASEAPSSKMSGFEKAMICFISFSAPMAGSLVKSNRPSGVYTLVLMLCVMGASERQPWESKVAPHGDALESTIFWAPARKSSQVAGAASVKPALVVRPECHPEPITSRKNGQL